MSAILVTAAFALGAVAAIVGFVLLIASHWWILGILAGLLFLIVVLNDSSPGSVPVHVSNLNDVTNPRRYL